VVLVLCVQVWENLQSAGIKYHVADNYRGTFLTMWSTGGIVFGIINIVSTESEQLLVSWLVLPFLCL
jgi:hypothetical protein